MGSHNSKLPSRKPWVWITRNVVETKIAKCMNTPGSAVMIRGPRQCGKFSTVKHVADRLQKETIILSINQDSHIMLADRSGIGTFNRLHFTAMDIMKVIEAYVLKGTVIIIKDIQNASNSFQINIRRTFNKIAYYVSQKPDRYSIAGSVFLMGSPMRVVDVMCGKMDIQTKITMHPLDTAEFIDLMCNLDVQDSSLLLSFHACFGGNIFVFQRAYEDGLFDNNNRENRPQSVDILKSLFASTQQSDDSIGMDATKFLRSRYGHDYAESFKAVYSKTSLKEQIDELSFQLKDHQNAREVHDLIQNELCQQYGLLQPIVSATDFNDIARYELTDPLDKLALELQSRYPVPTAILPEDLHQLEVSHMTDWIQKIADDRQLILNEPALPSLSPCHCIFLPKLEWDFGEQRIEIALLGAQPRLNTLIIGSCQRQYNDINESALETKLDILRSHKVEYGNILKSLGIRLSKGRSSVFVHYVHFVPYTIGLQAALKEGHYVVTIKDLLVPFFCKSLISRMERQLHEDQVKSKTTDHNPSKRSACMVS